jgi:hypothetical protein
MTVTGSAILDASIYVKFREILPTYDVSVLPQTNVSEAFRRIIKDISTPYFKMFIKNPTEATVQTIDAHKGFSKGNCSLVCRVVYIIIEIARRKEIAGYGV